MIPLLPGYHLAPTLSLPVPLLTTGGGGSGGKRRPDASSLVPFGKVLAVLPYSTSILARTPWLLSPASSPPVGVLAAGSPAPVVWALSSLALLVELATLQSGSRPVDPVFRLEVAPLVVPSICGGGSCSLALGPVAAVAALVPAGWVSFSLSLRLLAQCS